MPGFTSPKRTTNWKCGYRADNPFSDHEAIPLFAASALSKIEALTKKQRLWVVFARHVWLTIGVTSQWARTQRWSAVL